MLNRMKIAYILMEQSFPCIFYSLYFIRTEFDTGKAMHLGRAEQVTFYAHEIVQFINLCKK